MKLNILALALALVAVHATPLHNRQDSGDEPPTVTEPTTSSTSSVEVTPTPTPECPPDKTFPPQDQCRVGNYYCAVGTAWGPAWSVACVPLRSSDCPLMAIGPCR